MFKKALQTVIAIVVATYATLASAQVATQILTNKSGGTVAQYSVIVLDSANNEAFTTTATERASKICGVILQSGGIANNATGIVALFGILDVKCTGAVTRGDYVITSTTAGSAKTGGTTNPNGAFGVALETGTATNVSCFVFPSPPAGGGTTELHLQDDVALVWGTDNDIQATYDEAGENRLEFDDGTNLLMWLTDAGTTGTGGVTGVSWNIGDWLLAEGTGDFDFGPTADGDAFTFDDDGDLHLSAGNLLVDAADATIYDDLTVGGRTDSALLTFGVAHTYAANCWFHGGSTTNGPQFVFYNSANEDDVYDYYKMEPQGLQFYIGPDTDLDAFMFDGDGDLHLTAGNLLVDAADATIYDDLTVSGTSDSASMFIGTNDSKAGANNVYGDNANQGGKLSILNSGNEDGTYNHYVIEANTNLWIGPDTNTNAFIFDGDADIHAEGNIDAGVQFQIAGVQITTAALSNSASIGMLDEAETVTANWIFGNATTDTYTFTGRMILRQVNDAGMAATNGSTGEAVFNLSDTKFYGCVAGGTPGTWIAFH